MHPLAARLARGDEAAFAELYDECADRLFAYLTAKLGSRDRAADVVQETFLRVATGRRLFRNVDNPVAYVFQIARNEAIRFTARERRGANVVVVPAELFAVENPFNQEMAELAAAALSRIDREDREFVELRIFAGLTFREISELTAIPQATVATRYRRAIQQLRPWLEKQIS